MMTYEASFYFTKKMDLTLYFKFDIILLENNKG